MLTGMNCQKIKKKYQRGDIVLVPFPFTDLSSTKKRPALIISNDEVNVTGDFTVVMITSQDK
jgi:mRNA interferase MazF